MPNYEIVEKIGAGTFGIVYKGYDHINDRLVAIKRTRKETEKISREFKILDMLKDSNYVVKLFDIFYSITEEKKLIQNLVFEYMDDNLEAVLAEYRINNKYIPIEQIKFISRNILLGLEDIHKKNIVHRDIKPDNILISKDGTVKIADFGSSKIIKNKESSTPYIVSRYYRAPELILGATHYSQKIDIFSAGCIIGELFKLMPLFMGEKEGYQIIEQICLLGNPDDSYFDCFDISADIKLLLRKAKLKKKIKISHVLNQFGYYQKKDIEDAEDLLINMLNFDYDERFTANLCLKHPFFSVENNIK